MICLVFEFREEKQTFAKVKEEKVEFFHIYLPPSSENAEPHRVVGNNERRHHGQFFYNSLIEMDN
jgi:hypothetical protein